MKMGMGRVAAVVIAFAAAASSIAWAAAVEVAKARPTAGNSSVTRDGKTTKVGSTTQFQEGDVLRLETDVPLLTVEFGDGSSMALVGPAVVRFGEMTPKGRRVVLASGVVSKATVLGIALEIQAPSPYDASMVLQNSTGFARVNPGDRIDFQKLDGDYAKAYQSGQETDLVPDSPWLLNVRSGTVTAGPQPRQSGASDPSKPSPFIEKALPNDYAKITNGRKAFVFHPASAFTRERTSEGGVRLCFQGAANEWGVVEIGLETTLFLAKGQCVEFDAYGNIVRFDGISHIYQPLLDAIMNDEPVDDATDASPIFRRHH